MSADERPTDRSVEDHCDCIVDVRQRREQTRRGRQDTLKGRGLVTAVYCLQVAGIDEINVEWGHCPTPPFCDPPTNIQPGENFVTEHVEPCNI